MSAGELIVETARRGELHHAIILHGHYAEEMTRLALDVARVLNCPEHTTGDGCHSCQKIDRGIHPDVHVIAVAESRKLISIEQIRTMIEEATLRPYEGRAKVFIVQEADAMSASGANALLKTLEEPAPDTIFILITRSADRLLPTIRSRSQAIAIRHTAPEPAATVAERSGIPLQQARLMATASSSEEAEEIGNMTTELLAALGRFARTGETSVLLAIAARLGSHEDPALAVASWVGLLRDLVGLSSADTLSPTEVDRIRKAIPESAALDAAHVALRNLNRLSVNADPRLMMEQSVLRLAKAR